MAPPLALSSRPFKFTPAAGNHPDRAARQELCGTTEVYGMRVADMMKPGGRVFLKSEWGQISDEWPCVSFTKRSVGDQLRREFVAGRDVLIYVGTTDPETTRLAEHRSRLISAVTIEPNQVLETRKIVPLNVWAKSNAQWGDRWPYSMAVISAANIVGPPFPAAHDVIPAAYRPFSEIANRGGVVEALESEREAVMSLNIEPISLDLREDVRAYFELRSSLSPERDSLVKKNVNRMARLIVDRVERGGDIGVKINPIRYAPNLSDLYVLLMRKWTDQRGRCSLCGGQLATGNGSSMLQPSADRIDSANGAYDDENVWITHLACNLAKNKYGTNDFEQWLAVIRGVDLDQE